MNLLRPIIVLLVVGSPLRSSFAQAAELERWRTPDLYDYGTALLKKGRLFNRAITALGIAARREPSNLDYQLALGCAAASRYASVALAALHAQRYENELKGFEIRLQKWEKVRDEPILQDLQNLAPLPPPPPTTLDDDAAFALTQAEAREELRRLGLKAVGAFESARRLSHTTEQSDQVRTDFARGWGLLLLRRFGKGVVVADRPTGATSIEPLCIPEKEIVSCFKACADAVPKNADYWQSLALAEVPRFLDSEDATLELHQGNPLYSEERIAEASAALQHALDLRPRDFNLLRLMSLFYAFRPERSARYLEKAATRIGDNAVLWNELAERRFQLAEQRHGEEKRKTREMALTAIEAGNRARRYAAISLALPTPPLLKRAWESAGCCGIEDTHVFMAVFEGLSGVLRGDNPDPELAFRAAAAEFAFGLKVMQALDGDDLDGRNPRHRASRQTRQNLAPAFCADGYQEIEKSYAAHPDSRKARFLEENAALFARVRQLVKLLP